MSIRSPSLRNRDYRTLRPREFIGMGDLVTDMQEVKHYYTLGILPRDGIDHRKPRLTGGSYQ